MYSKYSFHRRLTLRLLCIALCACMALNGCSSTSLPDDTLSSEQEETDDSVSSSEDSAYTYSDYELDDSFDRQSAASIILSGSTAQSNGSGVSINNATVTISKEGCYLISGELEDGQIIVDAGDSDKVQLVLDNASIHCSTGSAILVRNADKVKVTLAADSENELSDGTEYQTDDDNPDAALFSKDDLVINGSGSLTVQGNYKHGIAGNDDLVITGGRLTVNSLSHALRGKDSVAILDGTFVLTSQKDGIHAEAYLNINGGTTTIAESYEGLEAAQIHISGGTTQVFSSDDGLNAAGGSSFELVDGLLVLKDNSSSDTEQTFGGRGGMFEVEDNCDITISGGNLTVTTSNGDGIDSNGSLNVSGGTVLVFGSSSGGEGALDYTGSSSISGGTLVALGSSGMAQSMEPDDSHATLMVTWDEVQPTGTRLTLCTQQGEILCSLQSTNSFQTAVISTDSLSAGQKVSLYTSGTVNSDSQLLTMGTLSDGELLCEVTLSEGVTNISSDGSQRSSQPGGSFGGGQRPQGDRKQRPQQELTIGSSAESNS
mgnify:CR=1 FL=1